MGKEQEHSIHEFIWEEKEEDEDFRRYMIKAWKGVRHEDSGLRKVRDVKE